MYLRIWWRVYCHNFVWLVRFRPGSLKNALKSHVLTHFHRLLVIINGAIVIAQKNLINRTNWDRTVARVRTSKVKGKVVTKPMDLNRYENKIRVYLISKIRLELKTTKKLQPTMN